MSDYLFISHSTRDGATLARDLVAALEAARHKCWVAPRDVKPGIPYPGQIVTAIEASAGVVVIVTNEANTSPDVLQEVQLASSARKLIAPVIAPGVQPGPDIRYYIGVRHNIGWTDAAQATAELLRSFPVVAPLSRQERDAQIDKEFREGLTKDVTVSRPLQLKKPVTDDANSSLRMLDFGPNKIPIIKVVRQMTRLGLKEAKDLVESAPVTLARSMPREMAEKFELALSQHGAKAQIGPAQPITGDAKFIVMMTDLGPNKITVIKLVKEATGLGLAETKALVESPPPVVLANDLTAQASEFLLKGLLQSGASAFRYY